MSGMTIGQNQMANAALMHLNTISVNLARIADTLDHFSEVMDADLAKEAANADQG